MFHVKHARKNRKEGILVRFHKKKYFETTIYFKYSKTQQKIIKICG